MAQSNVTSMVENLESGECQLLGPENVLIPEGIYQASYMYYETNGMFAKKAKATKAKLEGFSFFGKHSVGFIVHIAGLIYPFRNQDVFRA